MTAGGTILIVEEHADERDAYALAFETQGFRVLTADRLDEAVDIAEREEPDAVVTAGILREAKTGWDVARKLRKGKTTAGPLLVLLTGLDLRPDQADAVSRWCDYLVAKPCRPLDLVRLVAEALTPERRAARPATRKVRFTLYVSSRSMSSANVESRLRAILAEASESEYELSVFDLSKTPTEDPPVVYTPTLVALMPSGERWSIIGDLRDQKSADAVRALLK